MIGLVIVIVVVAVAVLTLAGAIWFAWDSDKRIRRFARSTELVPGSPGRAPGEWTTASSPEALLHRRIRYAIADVHGNPAIPHYPDVLAERDRLDDAVFGLDDRLIEAADLSDEEKTQRLERIEPVIVQLEELPRKLWEAPPETQIGDIDGVVDAVIRL